MNASMGARSIPKALIAAALGACLVATGVGSAQAQRSASRPADRTVIIAGHTLMPDGSLASGRAVVIERGVIVGLQDASDFEGDESVMRYPGHVLSPGLIELGSSLGVRGNQSGGSGVIEPSMAAADAIDPGDPALRHALEAGITAAMVLPDTSRIVAGRAATFRTHPIAGGVGPKIDMLNGDGPAVLSMGPQVLDFNFGPTSRAGAAFELRAALESARTGEGPLAELLPNPHGIIALCAQTEDVDLILMATAEPIGNAGEGDGSGRLTIIHTPSEPPVATDLAGEEVPFAVGPLTFDTPSVALISVASLSNAGATVAFVNRSPFNDPDWLRISAALAVRHGMDPAAARRALTSAPAQIAGVEVGRIRAGAPADLVLFSGDPLLLSSTPDIVMINGQRVHGQRPSVDEIGASEGPGTGGTRSPMQGRNRQGGVR
ncbi:MAG: amidohydrolase family protein [Phycisphaerales bacterium]